MRVNHKPEYFCDICRNKVHNDYELYEVSIEYMFDFLSNGKKEVCKDCRKRIADFIKQMEKEAVNEHSEGP